MWAEVLFVLGGLPRPGVATKKELASTVQTLLTA